MDKKAKKELKKTVKRSRKRLQQIDDPTAWVDEISTKAENERLRVENALLRAKLEELK